MLGFFERQRLIKKGLASPKTRRRRPGSEFLQTLETGTTAKVAIFAAFIAGLGMLIFYGTVQQPAEFLVMSLISGFIAVFVTLQVRRRSRLLRAGVFVGLATWILAVTFRLIGPFDLDLAGGANWKMITAQSMAAVGSGVLTAIL